MVTHRRKGPIVEKEHLSLIITHLLHSHDCMMRELLLRPLNTPDKDLVFRVVLGIWWKVVRPLKLVCLYLACET